MSNHKRALSGICVLLVDDEPDSRELTSFVLQQAGAKVVSTSSGAEALAAISLQVPDLVISDVGMPEVDGYMLMRQIRQLPAAKGGCVPAIALTAYAGGRDRQKALEAGFQIHLSKPADIDLLIRTVSESVN